MRRLILILIPLILLYLAWFYWQSYSDRPLNERLITAASEDIEKITISGHDRDQPFSLTRTDDSWVVVRSPRQILDQTLRVQALVDRLSPLMIDSVSRETTVKNGTLVTLHYKSGEQEELVFGKAGGEAPLVQVVATGDVFHLPSSVERYILPALRFDHYRQRKLLHLLPGQVDSVVASRNDSTLWVIDSAASRLSKHLLAPAAAPYADFFDEIAHRDRYLLDLNFFFSGKAHRVQVFQDSLWPQPYVLVGDDFPRRFLGFERIR